MPIVNMRKFAETWSFGDVVLKVKLKLVVIIRLKQGSHINFWK
jgi:hypothetical protein